MFAPMRTICNNAAVIEAFGRADMAAITSKIINQARIGGAWLVSKSGSPALFDDEFRLLAVQRTPNAGFSMSVLQTTPRPIVGRVEEQTNRFRACGRDVPPATQCKGVADKARSRDMAAGTARRWGWEWRTQYAQACKESETVDSTKEVRTDRDVS